MRIPGWLFIVGVAALISGTAICSVVSFTFARQAAVDLGKNGVQVGDAGGFTAFLRQQPTITPSPSPAPPTATPRPGDTPVPTLAAPTATVDPSAQYVWTDPRRINILLMGIDQRQGETGTFNTDTMMVFSIDPVRKTVGILSIPRDLWVDIPGFQPSRINTAERLGETSDYPGGGPALAEATITQNLGIPINKYILINFDVFTTVINAIAPDGVQVCPTQTIDDPNYPDAGYGFIHVHFDAGCQKLDATHLLQYARTRHTPGSDFDRAARQQEVIKAVRDTVMNAGGIARFIGVAPQLYSQLSGSYKTDLSLDDMLKLANLAQQIPKENIISGQIDEHETSQANVTLGGAPAQVLILDHTAIRTLLEQVFNPPQNLSLGDLRTRAQAENAKIAIFNNTTLNGLAGQTRDFLASRQVTIADLGNMPKPDNSQTIIRDYKGKTYTALYLAQLLGLPQDRIQAAGSDGLTNDDVMVVVGSDIQSLLAGQPTTMP